MTVDPSGYARYEKGFASGRPIKLDTPETKYSEELDAYANLLEDEAVGSSPAAPVRPIPLGHKVDQLPGYLRHLRVTGTIAIAPPRERQEPPLLPPMLVGQSRPHPPYVHEFFPPFPEPHTYIHTEISGEPDLSYEAVRKTAAQRRREMERSLINYMMCMHPHTTLFPQFESKIRNEAKQY
ncbi:hypothetical protein TELCIR_19423, partial [Teladorsagia circumcincta]